MQHLLRTLSSDRIVYGKKYLFIEMWYSGRTFQRAANQIIFVEKLADDYLGQRAIVDLRGARKERYLESFGLISGKHFHFHRVIEYTRINVLVLSLIKSPFDYLRAIGFSEKEARAEIFKKINGPKSH